MLFEAQIKTKEKTKKMILLQVSTSYLCMDLVSDRIQLAAQRTNTKKRKQPVPKAHEQRRANQLKEQHAISSSLQ
jgi:hypothetical protein